MRMLKVSLTLIILLFSKWGWSTDPSLNWQTLKSENFNVHFEQSQFETAKKVVEISEQVYPGLIEWLNWKPEDEIEIVLTDAFDTPNGSATPYPYNRVNLRIVPPTEGSLIEYDDWMRVLIVHELTHIVHLDKSQDLPEFGRSILGRFPLFFPNLFQQRWFIEGLATYVETDPEYYTGRGQSSYFEMMMRTEVMNGLRPLSQVNLDSREWPFNSAYLYGLYFFLYLEDEYGREGIARLVENYSDNIVPYLVVSNTHSTFGKDIDDLWIEFESWLNTRFAENIERNPANPSLTMLTKLGLRSGQATVMGQQLWYIDQNPYEKPTLYSTVSEQVTHEIQLESGARISADQNHGVLVTQPEFCDEYNIYYKLYRIKNDKELEAFSDRCERYQYLAWHPTQNQFAAVKFYGGVTELLLVDGQSGAEKVMYTSTENAIGKISWRSENEIIAAIKRPGLSWDLGQISIETLTHDWEWIVEDSAVALDPFIAGNNLYYTRGEKGYFNIARLNLVTGQHEQITDLATGGFRPAVIEGQGLFFDLYGQTGFNLARIKDEHLVNIPINSQNRDKKLRDSPEIKNVLQIPYNPWSTLIPTWWLPYAVNDGTLNELGISIGSEDALANHSYTALITQESNYNETLGNMSYVYDQRFLINFSRRLDVDKDLQVTLVGDAETTDDDIEVIYDRKNIISNQQFFLLEPFLSNSGNHFIATGFGLQQEEVEFINLRSSDDSLQANKRILNDNVLGIGWNYDSTGFYTLSQGASDGRKFLLQWESSDLIKGDTEGEVVRAEWREYLSFSNLAGHQLASRAVVAFGDDRTSDFRLGGVGSDAIAGAAFQFQRRQYPLRGYSDNFRGDNLGLASLEWRTPLTLIERGWMWIPVAAQNTYFQFFAESGTVWNEGEDIEMNSSVGLELVNDFSLGYSYFLRTRLGFAEGLGETGSSEVYFTLGGSF